MMLYLQTIFCIVMRYKFHSLTVGNFMKAILPLVTAVLLFLSGCGQFTTEDETSKQFTGNVKDPAGNLLSDVKVFLIYHFDYTGIMQKNPAFPLSGAYLEQNYPDPFSKSSSFKYYIMAETSLVKFDIYRFDGELTISNLHCDTACSGTYLWEPDLSSVLPANGYKIIMKIDEADSSYTFEREFIRSYVSFDTSIVNTIPNAITANGRFELPYNTLPIGKSYVVTSEADPTPLGNCRVNEMLTVVLYKPGYKIYKEDVLIKLERYINKDFILQPE